MSSSSWGSSNRISATRRVGDIIAGYFVSGDDAHRAIDELLDEGLSARDIGAAFHCGTASSSAPTSRKSVTEFPTRSASKSDATVAGPASGTTAVSPWGLSTGGGTVIEGPHRPGPIPGSKTPSGLPTNIPSELASDESRPQRGNPPAAKAIRETSDNQTRWDKLENVFDGEHTTAGTGEGRLAASSGYDFGYSNRAFEASFAGMGIPQNHSRRLAQELQRGGAVVTVRAGSMNAKAEEIIGRNRGIIRYESFPAAKDAPENANPDARVEIFGEVHRVYPDYVSTEDLRERKAS